ncbi:RecQ family ATP-dependent DNA helicase [Fodinibius sediminis]|uniref:DNA 3'-5' helicase n=1 Tax=Fodinibius sediminis TaxID=1214077 RepID=A0A521FFJ8_9BACT|nr:RecQ family ATP-dependent DNA helicase [Fodinibius sediminis]SMO94976.1 ATP-dependent DNA helicase RecQ [Fodinibius sediminis]
MVSKADKVFENHFPSLVEEFEQLKDFQRKVINHVIEEGSSVAVMQTGGGKSLIYWVSAKALGGTTLVISPLIALIDEQAEKLRNLNFEVLVTHSGISSKELREDLTKFCNGNYDPDFIFVSPERLATDGYFEYCIKQRKEDIRLVTVDEIHCVSQWGFNFRPFYKRIPNFLNKVFKDDWPRVLGLTATINPKELRDICQDFRISSSSILKDEILLRFDVNLNVETFAKEDEKEQRLWKLLKENKGKKTLIYLYRKYNKRGTVDLASKARSKGFKSTHFHGDMSSEERQDVIQSIQNDEFNVIFATNAFGMGIDIPDIDLVVHFMIPESVEQYYQEIGRAGRDGKGADAYLFYSNKNVSVRRTHFIDKSFPDEEELVRLWKKITNNNSSIKTLQYFHDQEIQDTLQFFLNANLISIESKAFTHVDIFEKIESDNIQEIVDSTRSGMITAVLNNRDDDIEILMNEIYGAISKGDVSFSKRPGKCLIIKPSKAQLDENDIENISKDIEEKKQYKHDLLDFLVYLLNNFEGTRELHQDIGRYLGVDKHKLNKIHETVRGEWVRSKSEVIIANLLYEHKIEYKYEEKLPYAKGKWIEPDFTFEINGQKYCLEHLGLLGDSEYDDHWTWKKSIYKQFNDINLLTTKESAGV